jgi:2-polyprenyl-3-methyl-5-hydroxy-6-metoxy-1,4-benzoquinol methylase
VPADAPRQGSSNMPASPDNDKLIAAIREVRERARSRAPQGELGLAGVNAPDLMPLLHARDAAEAKVAAIGSVNPRRGGLLNAAAQTVKRLIARALDWHVREQIEFNRASMACVQASLVAMTDLGRSMAALAAHQQELRREVDARAQEFREGLDAVARLSQEFNDLARHWAEWRTGVEERRSTAEIHQLRTISELQAAFQHRVTLMDQNFRESLRMQHGEFTRALEQNTLDVQQRLWKDLERIRAEYEKLIHSELRMLRQKTALNATPGITQPLATGASGEIKIDWMRFAEVFRGSEDRIRAQHQRYAQRFAGAQGEILDLGCGRGEFLEAAREAGLAARGVDLSEEYVALCTAKGLIATRANMFEYLESLPDRELGGVLCSQVIEHLPPHLLPELIRLLADKVRPGGLVAIETPNPECLAIFATHFYIDPTHTRPVPPALLCFYLQEAGFGNLEVERLEPAVESMPSLAALPAEVRNTFFGALDYAVIARKL